MRPASKARAWPRRVPAAYAGKTKGEYMGAPHGAVSRVEFDKSNHQHINHLSSYDCIMRYYQHQRQLSSETHLIARTCLEEAVALEPENSQLTGHLADMYQQEISVGFNATSGSSLERALRVAESAVLLDGANGDAHAVLGWILRLLGEVDRAIREVEEGVRLAPNNTEILGTAASVLADTGEYGQAEEIFGKILSINPNYPVWMNWVPANYHTVRGEHDEAIAWIERTGHKWWFLYHSRIAAARCALGDIEQGKVALEKALELEPNMAETHWPSLQFYWKGDGLYPLIEIVNAGLTACGWDVPPDPGPETFAQ